ncbi:MAG TPA: hypothetical protein VEZ20_11175 [Allosphingosinicella sp.]|jgi:hypothetical protein|nr:hypothetical protein [Allosphingosinicella sp.]
MVQFTPNEWLVLVLVFLLGLILGMAMMVGTKWKTRYREEVRKREAAEADRGRLESQLKHAEARGIAAHARDPVAPVGTTTTHGTAHGTRDTPIA